jgi:hypothetical protein
LLDESSDEELETLRQHAVALDAPAVTYDPYKYATFVIVRDETPIFEASRALVFGKKVLVLPE